MPCGMDVVRAILGVMAFNQRDGPINTEVVGLSRLHGSRSSEPEAFEALFQDLPLCVPRRSPMRSLSTLAMLLGICAACANQPAAITPASPVPKSKPGPGTVPNMETPWSPGGLER